MFEVVPLADVIGKLDEETARKIRGDSAGKEELPQIPADRPHRSVRLGNKAGAPTSVVARAGSEMNHG